MKAVVLAGGYAKRMWPLTENCPKQLLQINGKPILDYVLEELELVDDIDKIFVSTNSKFASMFNDFISSRSSKKPIELVEEPTHSEEEKFGSIGAVKFLMDTKGLDEDVIILGGDNLFEFKFVNLVKHLEEKKANIIVLDEIGSIEEAKKYGVAEIDASHKVISFHEKPEQPKSRLVATACYILTKKGLEEIRKYIGQGGDADKMGHFIEWLCKNDDVYAFTFEGRWFDIGSIESYEQAKHYFENKKIENT
ncbi:nucleotidyltransferase family protein [Candidatus Woesearchaeota archaeon]|nr:nucleotidyltransferase family protein [Candidatus Woesearchaeota archaeon]